MDISLYSDGIDGLSADTCSNPLFRIRFPADISLDKDIPAVAITKNRLTNNFTKKIFLLFILYLLKITQEF